MKIADNILRHCLKNVMFITGTAYAGKSTLCRMLAEKYDLVHCGENYAPNEELWGIIDQENQPNLNYFNTKSGWDEYLNRKPEVYMEWIYGNSEEIIGFEIAQLLKIPSDRKVIVDSNIPIDSMKKIAGYNQIAVMLSYPGAAEDYFFERDDPEKIFLRKQIAMSQDPEKTMLNFKECMKKIAKRQHKELVNSDCFIIERKSADGDERDELMERLEEHFNLV